MARSQQNNVDYFPHNVTHGKKMLYIEKKYRNDGYATWFKLLEALGETNFHYLDIREDLTLMFLTDKCNVTAELLMEIIGDLVRMEEFNKELFEVGILYSDKFIDSVADAYKKRVTKTPARLNDVISILKAKGREIPLNINQSSFNLPTDCTRIDTQTNQSTNGNTQSKVKYSKVEEIKEEESNEFSAFEEIGKDFDLVEADLKEEKLALIKDILVYFNMGEEKFYFKEQSEIGIFVNLLFFNQQQQHFKTQFENYKLYKHLSQTQKHQLFSFTGTNAESFANGKWNSSNWGAMLEGISQGKTTFDKPGKQTLEEKIDIVSTMVNPHDPNAQAPN